MRVERCEQRGRMRARETTRPARRIGSAGAPLSYLIVNSEEIRRGAPREISHEIRVGRFTQFRHFDVPETRQDWVAHLFPMRATSQYASDEAERGRAIWAVYLYPNGPPMRVYPNGPPMRVGPGTEERK